MAARIFRERESKQTRACAAHDSAPLRDGRDHFNKGATLLPGKMNVLENTTNFTFLRILTSQTI